MHSRAKHTLPKRRRGLIIVISLFGLLIIIMLAMILMVEISNHPDKATNQSNTGKSQVSQTVHHKREAATRILRQSNSAAGVSQLAAVSQNAVEDPATRTNNGDITYSQFYMSGSSHHWYWSFSSSKRGQVETAQVIKLTKTGPGFQLAVISRRYQIGTPYTLNLTWLNNSHTKYNLHTNFENINGDYTVGSAAIDDYSQVNDTSTSDDVGSWIQDTLNGVGEELPETRTNGGEKTVSQFYESNGTWYWLLDTQRRGDIVIAQITSGTVSNDQTHAVLNLVNTIYPYYHTHFQLTIDRTNNGNDYTLRTPFQSIYGKYRLGD